MGLRNITAIDDKIHLATWEINESFEFLRKNTRLSPTDERILADTRHQGKAKEFLAGRLLCQEALAELNISHVPIYRNLYGAPQIPDSHFHISLSHTETYIALLIGEQHPVGIDIEKPKAKMAAIAPRLYSEKEIAFCEGDLDKISKVWSAKEVLYKLFMKREIDFKKHLEVAPADEDWKQMRGSITKNSIATQHTLQFESMEGYYLCYNLD